MKIFLYDSSQRKREVYISSFKNVRGGESHVWECDVRWKNARTSSRGRLQFLLQLYCINTSFFSFFLFMRGSYTNWRELRWF